MWELHISHIAWCCVTGRASVLAFSFVSLCLHLDVLLIIMGFLFLGVSEIGGEKRDYLLVAPICSLILIIRSLN